MRFPDRDAAGSLLAARLAGLAALHPIVLALPRGGVPVAVPVVAALGAPLDLLFARKIGAPGNPEYGIGAVVEGDPPLTVLDEARCRELGVPESHIAATREAEIAEIARRRACYLGGRARIPVGGRVVVLVDDGIATGATVRAALRALAEQGAARRVLAVPVASPEAAAALRRDCEEMVVLETPAGFRAVGQFYDDFRQIEDDEVIAMLARASPGDGAALSPA
jgi:putative phosphoribosyl transferase